MPKEYDVVVLGGGIHGAGVAQAAAAAGFSVLVLEQQALAHGTSGRSSKLIHGGLRYLEGAHFGLVRESLREREILLRLAPALVRRVPFYIPVYQNTRRPPWMIRAGLSLYAVLGGLNRLTQFKTVPRSQWPDLDGLSLSGLRTVFRYEDAQTDDAQLTEAVMRSAQNLGAQLRCPAVFHAAEKNENGYRVDFHDDLSAQTCHARALVNATGPWVNRVLERITPPLQPRAIDLVQGAHIVLESEVRHGIYYVEAPRDGRAVFIMPWKGRTLVGTTETSFDGDPSHVRPTADEIGYLLETRRHFFPREAHRVVESFAGLRVLPRGPAGFFHRSRETLLHPDDPHAPRLITIYGGKLTGYRATAAKVIRQLRGQLPPAHPRADTAKLKLSR